MNAELIYSMLRHGLPYVAVGQDVYEQQYRDCVVKNFKRNVQALGSMLVPNSIPDKYTTKRERGIRGLNLDL